MENVDIDVTIIITEDGAITMNGIEMVDPVAIQEIINMMEKGTI